MGQTLIKENCHILNEEMKDDDVFINNKSRKGIYPYEYVKTQHDFKDINEIMKETELPSRDKFYSILNQKNISENDYKLAQQNWIDLKFNTIKDCTMKYLKLDVLILADVFENLREMCLKNYEIDPCYTFSNTRINMKSRFKIYKN